MKTAETKTTPTEATISKTEGKNIAIIAYITFIGLLVAFVMNGEKKNEFAQYHIRQSLGLALTGLVLGAIGMIPILGWIINILGFFVMVYMWVIGLMNAINEKESPVPLLGKKYEEWFKNI
ncbi:DUF4870 domain-containing protein [Aequorivita lipolytica]|uniref:DUF4870 domain-containing protein n=1 Tax=Aequorivita lipolytica TaxID=153267 RepID=A0A5C6YNZ7_9FLAO|nr:hypothetical protein [Aequorivita lipolytica]TXD68581.1 hypothetical protein ESV24_11755 [Aequorivita lipolytica]SRX53269.1 hypothetical protein AEQU2_02499 [Aequorivita lipolytica]